MEIVIGVVIGIVVGFITRGRKEGGRSTRGRNTKSEQRGLHKDDEELITVILPTIENDR